MRVLCAQRIHSIRNNDPFAHSHTQTRMSQAACHLMSDDVVHLCRPFCQNVFVNRRQVSQSHNHNTCEPTTDAHIRTLSSFPSPSSPWTNNRCQHINVESHHHHHRSHCRNAVGVSLRWNRDTQHKSSTLSSSFVIVAFGIYASPGS